MGNNRKQDCLQNTCYHIPDTCLGPALLIATGRAGPDMSNIIAYNFKDIKKEARNLKPENASALNHTSNL